MNANNKDIPDKINATGKPLKRNKNVTIKKIITISILISY